MKVLDLFAGLKGWSEPFEKRGHEVFSIDNDTKFDVSLHKDIFDVSVSDIPWIPDIILASPPCGSFSVMTVSRNWTHDHQPKTERATEALRLVEKARELVNELSPRFFIFENPIGKLRKLPPLADLDNVMITYCQYGEPYMKPTDLWGGFPPSFQPRPKCKNGDPCHVAAPRGSKTGVQDEGRTKFRGGMIEDMSKIYSTDPRRHALSALRAKVPYELAHDICIAAEKDL